MKLTATPVVPQGHHVYCYKCPIATWERLSEYVGKNPKSTTITRAINEWLNKQTKRTKR